MDRKNLKNRVAKVFANAKKVDMILLTCASSMRNFQDPNLLYLADFISDIFEGSFLVVSSNKAAFFSSPLAYDEAQRDAPKGMKVVNLNTRKKLNLLVKQVKGKAIGVSGSFVSYRTYKNIRKRFKPKRLVDVSDAFAKAREIKDNEEIRRIRKGVRITKKAIAQIQRQLRVGITEKDVADNFEKLVLKLGADDLSFDTIVSFEKNTAFAHHTPDSTRLKLGNLVLIDAGVMVENYASDITRTMVFGKGKDYEKKIDMLNIVKEAQRRSIAAIKQGAKGKDIHMIAENYLYKANNGRYKGTFIHALGHSVGLEVHDEPRAFLSPNSKLILRDGMITSVEPGVYVPGFGGVRIEDDVLVTKKGAVIL